MPTKAQLESRVAELECEISILRNKLLLPESDRIGEVMSLELPLPPPDARPNARLHWGAKYRVTRNLVDMAYEAGLELKANNPQWHYPLKFARFTYHFTNPRDIDWVNLTSMMKFYEDGLCKSTRDNVVYRNVVYDDGPKYIALGGHTFTQGSPSTVAIEIEPIIDGADSHER